MNSENSKTSDSLRLLLNLTYKINLKRSDKDVALSDLSISYTWKNIKSCTKRINLKYQLQHRMKSLNYLRDHILYQIFKITLNTHLQKHEAVTDNLTIRIYVNKVEKRITFKIKTRYYLELLTPETIKLLGSTKSKITTEGNSENVLHLDIT